LITLASFANKIKGSNHQVKSSYLPPQAS